MTIEPPRPEFRQLVSAIRAAIQAGEFPPGSQLPPEPELAARFGVTRATVNRALSVLRTEGLIRPARGRGTTVNPLPVLLRATIKRQGRAAREEGTARGAFAAEVQRQGLVPRVDVTVQRALAPASVAEILGIPPEAPALVRSRVMYANDIPVQLATSYLPLAIAEGTAIMQEDAGTGGIYSRLADIGHAPVHLREAVRVRPPEETEARTLQLDADHRVYDITRIARDKAGQAVEVNRMTLPAHQWELDTEWRV